MLTKYKKVVVEHLEMFYSLFVVFLRFPLVLLVQARLRCSVRGVLRPSSALDHILATASATLLNRARPKRCFLVLFFVVSRIS